MIMFIYRQQQKCNGGYWLQTAGAQTATNDGLGDIRMNKNYILLVIFLVLVEACVGYGISERFLKKTIKMNTWLNVSEAAQILTEDYAREKLGLSNTTASVDAGEDDTGDIPEEDSGADAPEDDTGASTSDSYGELPKLYRGGYTGEGSLALTADAEESSFLSREGKDHTAYEAIDGDAVTSWQAEIDAAGEGAWLRFELQQEYPISYLTIMPGNWQDEDGRDYYHENSRPHKMRVTVGAQAWNLEFPDEKVQYRLELAQPIQTDMVQIEIISVYTGTAENITCVAEIGIYCAE